MQKLVRSFALFHLTLGAVVFAASVMTLAHATGGPHVNPHLALLAGIEAIGAVLFLLPWTLRLGGTLLLVTFAIAILLHFHDGSFPMSLLVYAAGTFFVMTHGEVFTRLRMRAPA